MVIAAPRHVSADDALAVVARAGLDARASTTIVDDAKSFVARVATSQGDFIVKGAARAAVARDRFAFSTLLPAAGLRSPEVRWFEADADPSLGWIIVSAVDGRAFGSDEDDARALARWLAALHAHPVEGLELPQRAADAEIGRLALARATLRGRMDAARDTDDRWVIASAIAVADSVERHWPEIAASASWSPSVIVHGDLAPENIVMQGSNVYVLDWEKAAIGNPAIDVARVDATEYAAARGVDVADVERVARVGALARTLSHNWGSKQIGSVERFARRLERELALALAGGGA